MIVHRLTIEDADAIQAAGLRSGNDNLVLLGRLLMENSAVWIDVEEENDG